jgi:hypothetical protein
MAQLLETLPRWHPLALLEGLVPGLGRAVKMIRGQRPQAAEELLTVAELVQRILRAVICSEVQFVELWRRAISIGGWRQGW